MFAGGWRTEPHEANGALHVCLQIAPFRLDPLREPLTSMEDKVIVENGLGLKC